MNISIQCPLFPSESESRVYKALTNIILSITPRIEQSDEMHILKAESNDQSSLNWLRQRIHELRIIDAIRHRLQSNIVGFTTSFSLDKQAAFSGKIRIVDDSVELPPLKCIEIFLDFKNSTELEEFFSWFVPSTRDGYIIKD